MNPKNRQGFIRSLLQTHGIDGLLLSSEPNVSYAAGLQTSETYGLLTSKRIFLITDFRYAADLRRFAQPPISVRQFKKSLFEALAAIVAREKIKKIGFESRHLTFAECEHLHQRFDKHIALVPLQKTLEPLREIKDAEEVACIQKALAVAKKTLAFVRAKIKPGRSEAHLAADMERFVRLHGGASMAFETIVASGPNSSYPHARITDRLLKDGDPIVVDMGVELNGYKCDLTRTFFLGKINPIVLRAARVVRRAQELAINHVKPGVVIRSLDAVARHYIARQGFGKNFGHALGHGVGLEVHESPSISKKNERTLEPGMVFTIEPGIYLPGRFGIRMEEMVLVTQNGVEVLSGDDRN